MAEDWSAAERKLHMEQYKNPISSYEIKKNTTDAKVKKEYWSTGIGLNQVDGLKPSAYLLELAKDHIEGKIDTGKVKSLLETYYSENTENRESYECDLVSARIVELLDQGSFTFSPQTLKNIHKYLFTGIYDEKMVEIKDLYEYDFEQEKRYRYSYPISSQQIAHLSDFVSRIWQVHPFGEGNTRTTAVFIELYLRSMGFDVNNDMFQEHAVYFRGHLCGVITGMLSLALM